MEGSVDTASIASASSRLRGRVFQVGEIAGNAAGSANKVITGVFESFRGLIPAIPTMPIMPIMPNVPGLASITAGTGQEPDQTPSRPSMQPRQLSNFSLSTVAASVANVATVASTAAARSRSRASSRASATEQVWAGNQEMTEVVSRPESIHEAEPGPDDYEAEEPPDHDPDFRPERRKSDARSIVSVSSMMSGPGREKERVSVSNRLASIGGLGRMPSPHPDGSTSPVKLPNSEPSTIFSAPRMSRGRGSSLLGNSESLSRVKSADVKSPTPSVSSLPLVADTVERPIERFMTCEVGDIRLSEIGTLLRDYRRLAAALQAHGQS